MALASTDVFAAFDVTDGAQERDISPVLSKAIYYDLNLLGAMNVDFGSPVYDTTYRWNDDQLNGDTCTVNGSAASNATAVTLDTGHGVHIGDLLYDTVVNSVELLQATATAATAVTVTRSYNEATAASIADNAVLGIIRAEQEGSDIGSDRTLNPLVRTNYTQIFDTFDVKISGSQLARRMATNELQDFLAHQVANRAIEMKINLSRGFLYSAAASASPSGTDSVYRTLEGLREWATASGITNASSEAISLSVLNLHNKSAVDLGVFPDTLVIGTDLVSSVAAIDASVRRLRESDTQVGYTVQEIMLAQGNMVQVVVDSRVKTGDAFLFSSERVSAKPLNGRAMFVLAGSDWVDAKKRRILGEWTLEVRNPNTLVYLRNKT